MPSPQESRDHARFIARARRKFKKHDYARDLLRRSTPAERALWPYLANRRLGVEFVQQQVLWPWIVDFWCPEWNLVVELDGGYHNPRRDAFRDGRLARRKLVTLRFKNDEVFENVGGVLRRIYSAGKSQEKRLNRTNLYR